MVVLFNGFVAIAHPSQKATYMISLLEGSKFWYVLRELLSIVRSKIRMSTRGDLKT